MLRGKTNNNFVLRPIHPRAIHTLNHVQTFQILETTDNLTKLQLMLNGDTFGQKHHPLDFFEMAYYVVDYVVIDEIVKTIM